MKLLGFLLRSVAGRRRRLDRDGLARRGVGGVGLIAIVHAELSREAPAARAIGLAFAGSACSSRSARFVAQAAMARLGQGAVADLTTLIVRKVLGLPLAQFEAIDARGLVAS